MTKSDRKDGETLTQISTHENILELLEEIKGYEKLYPEYTVIEPEIDIESITTSSSDENDVIEKGSELIADIEREKKTERSRRRIKAIRIKRRKSKPDETITDGNVLEKQITPTTFNVGFDSEGNLVNLDVRKPKIKPKSESRFKKLGGLKRLRRGKKSENAGSASSEKSSKTSKLKGKIGKIGKLKNAIPHRGKNKEKGE